VTGNLVCHGAETATASAAKHARAERRMNRPIVPTTTFRQGSLPLTGAAETINGTHNARPATLRPTGGAPAADKAGIWGCSRRRSGCAARHEARRRRPDRKHPRSPSGAGWRRCVMPIPAEKLASPRYTISIEFSGRRIAIELPAGHRSIRGDRTMRRAGAHRSQQPPRCACIHTIHRSGAPCARGRSRG
jgi:hypothetical protein